MQIIHPGHAIAAELTPAGASPPEAVAPERSKSVVFHVTSVRVDRRQLLADLEAEARRVFGPTLKRRSAR